MFMLGVFGIAFCVLTAITAKVFRGDGRTDLRRCSHCWYDMSATESLRCPECGHVARTTPELYRPRRIGRAWPRVVGVLWALLIASAYFSLPGAWTTKVPHPVLALALSVGAPAPAPTTIGTQAGLPAPNPAFKDSKSAWERLVWNYQASIALRAWADAVLTNRGPITSTELSRLAPLAAQAHEIYMQHGTTVHNEARCIDRVKIRIARARDAAAGGDPYLALRYEWILSEMQFEGGDYSHRRDFALEPDAIILLALAHPDPTIRAFGIDRFGRRVHRVVVTPTSPIPPSRSLVDAIANADPDTTARNKARAILDYAEAFHLPK